MEAQPKPITPEQAFQLLWNGSAVRVGTSDNFPVFITDIVSRDVMESKSKEVQQKIVLLYIGSFAVFQDQ